MIKKFFTFGLLLSLVAFCGTSNAQEQEYPNPGAFHYGFWSNWSVGGSIDFVKQGGHGWKNNYGTTWGLNLIAEKELNHVWDYRLSLQFPGLLYTISADSKLKKGTGENGKYASHFDDYASLVMGVKMSLTDAIMGYNPDRRASLYLLAMAGLSAKRQEVTNTLRTGKSPFAVVGELGAGYSYRVCEHGTLFGEVIIDDHGAIHNPGSNGQLGRFVYTDVMISLGYLYNFGPTQADKDRLANLGSLPGLGADSDALNNEIAELKGKVDNKENQVKRLENRVAQLEKELADKGKNNNDSDLQRLVNQIKEDRMTYYALPFSILFDVDQYTVKASEMKKLDAIARVMKDNPNTKFNLYGFCDKSGSDDYNQKLSEKRVNEVRRLLVNKYGIAESRLTTEAMGKTVSFGDASYSINRRVSFYRVIE